MKRMLFLPSCAALALAGCGGGGGGGAQLRSREEALAHGPTTWAEAERKVRYAENVPVHKGKAGSAIVTQKDKAPGKAEASSPLTVESVAKSLLEAIRAAGPLAEGGLSYGEMAKLERPARDILIHSRELVTIFDRRAVRARIVTELGRKGEAPPEEASADLAALEEWMAVAARVERSAKRLFVGALSKTPTEVEKGWQAVLESGRKLPQIRAGINMMTLKKERRR